MIVYMRSAAWLRQSPQPLNQGSRVQGKNQKDGKDLEQSQQWPRSTSGFEPEPQCWSPSPYVFPTAPRWAHINGLWCHPAIKSTPKGKFSTGYRTCFDWRWAVSVVCFMLGLFFFFGSKFIINFYIKIWRRSGELPRSISEDTRTLKVRDSQSFAGSRQRQKTRRRKVARQCRPRYLVLI